MTAPRLRYSLALDRDLFDEADHIAQATMRVRHNPFVHPHLYLITDDKSELPFNDKAYVEGQLASADGLDGACCWRESNHHEFGIWMNPQLDPFTDYYRYVLLHELCHGYLGETKHGARFRDFYGRALYHYCDIASPTENVEGFLAFTVYRYSRRKKRETDEEFLSRIKREVGRIQERAEEEQDNVRYFYEKAV
jgi:hypothetical protein